MNILRGRRAQSTFNAVSPPTERRRVTITHASAKGESKQSSSDSVPHTPAALKEEEEEEEGSGAKKAKRKLYGDRSGGDGKKGTKLTIETGTIRAAPSKPSTPRQVGLCLSLFPSLRLSTSSSSLPPSSFSHPFSTTSHRNLPLCINMIRTGRSGGSREKLAREQGRPRQRGVIVEGVDRDAVGDKLKGKEERERERESPRESYCTYIYTTRRLFVPRRLFIPFVRHPLRHNPVHLLR